MNQSRAWDDEVERVHVVQGEYVVTDRDVVFSTILGSCVAACMRDPKAGVGGMNHFLLPDGGSNDDLRYGVHSMELLVNGLLRLGARRERLECKLFGGARLISGLSDIGARNGQFAQEFLKNEGIPVAGASLGGLQARRVQYWPVSGRARQALVAMEQSAPMRPPPAPAPSAGAVELF